MDNRFLGYIAARASQRSDAVRRTLPAPVKAALISIGAAAFKRRRSVIVLVVLAQHAAILLLLAAIPPKPVPVSPIAMDVTLFRLEGPPSPIDRVPKPDQGGTDGKTPEPTSDETERPEPAEPDSSQPPSEAAVDAPPSQSVEVDASSATSEEAILNALFRGPVNSTLGTNISDLAPNNFPRNDLVATFLTGIATLNQQSTVRGAEIMRLNTGVPVTPRDSQSTFGVVGDDLAGYPNGRRPGDDTVDITLRVAMGRLCYPVPINGTPTALGLCQPSNAPVGNVGFTDGAPIRAAEMQNAFPYLNTPIPGSPSEARNGGQ